MVAAGALADELVSGMAAGGGVAAGGAAAAGGVAGAAVLSCAAAVPPTSAVMASVARAMPGSFMSFPF